MFSKFFLPFLLTLLGLGLSGCQHSSLVVAAEEANRQSIAEGLPFRWTVKGDAMTRVMLALPSGPTRAGADLQHDILQRISAAEVAAYRPVAELADVKRLRDGREVWLLKATDQGIAYIVYLRPSAQGGVTIGLSEAILFAK
ncbi:MAG: hypothetical protein KA257_04380 [Opitutaceae bacterium]|jgi:hypothetical protein|nr:hypothetical protein [Opitutaceae bacterium]MBP9912047.1 hypothetical protein [Opitutaceae bacterium]